MTNAADRPFSGRAPDAWIEEQGSRPVRDAQWEVPREPGREIFIPWHHDTGDEDARERAGSWRPGATWLESPAESTSHGRPSRLASPSPRNSEGAADVIQ